MPYTVIHVILHTHTEYGVLLTCIKISKNSRIILIIFTSRAALCTIVNF